MFEEAVERSSMHEIICDQAGECKEALDAVLYSVSGAQEQECDQCDGDLDAHGVLGCAEEVPDFEGVLDPAEEQLSGKELARCRTLRLGPSPVPPHKNHS